MYTRRNTMPLLHAANNSVLLNVVSSAVRIVVNLVALLYSSSNLERQQFISFYTTFVVCTFFSRTLLHFWFVVCFLVSRAKIIYRDTRKSNPRDRYHHFLPLCSLGSYFLTYPFTKEWVNTGSAKKMYTHFNERKFYVV